MKLIQNFIKLCFKDLKEDLKNFEYWLKEIELRVENLSIDVRWDLGEIEKRLSEHIVS